MTHEGPQANIPGSGTSAAQGSVALLGSFFIMAVLNYVFAITMSWLLPVDRYGMLGVTQTLLLLGGTVVGAGFPWALTSALSRAPGSADNVGAFRTALVGNSAIGIVLGAGLCGAGYAGWLPFGPEYRLLLPLASATIVVLAVGAVFTAALQGFLRFGALGVVRMSEVVVKFIAGVAAVGLGAGVAGATAGFLAGAVCSMVLSASLLRNFRFWRGGGWGERQVYAGVFPLFVGMCSLAALVNADIIGLKLAGPAASADLLAGHYQAAVTLARIPIFLTLALFNAVFPYIAQHAERPDLAGAYATLALKYTLLFIVPIDIALIAIPGSVIGFLYPSDYGASATPLALAALGTIVLTLVHALTMLLQAAGHVRLPAVVLPASVILEVVSIAVLVPKLGTNGAPLAVLIAGGCGVIPLLLVTFRAFRLRLPLAGGLRYLAALAVFGLLLRFVPHDSRPGLVTAAVCAGTVYVALLIALGLLTRSDIEKLGEGLGPQIEAASRHVGRLVERCRVVSR